jgi:hypothetical protein
MVWRMSPDLALSCRSARSAFAPLLGEKQTCGLKRSSPARLHVKGRLANRPLSWQVLVTVSRPTISWVE